MISAFFIKRPKTAIVLSIIIIILGLISLQVLPVKEYPTITPPQITVTVTYPGADADTIAKSVAAPLEESINGVENMLYMISASSSAGIYTLNIFFEIGTDPNVAKMDVNNRVQLVLPRLPEEVRRQGIQVRERSPDFLKVIAFYSEGNQRDPVDLSNYILLNVVDEIKRIPGVGDAIVFDEKRYSIRVWLIPDKLYRHQLTPLEVYQAIAKQNQQFSGGVLAGEPLPSKNYFTFPVKGEARFTAAQQFGEIILKELSDGSSLKLKDVARIELSSETYNRNSFFKKQKVIPVGVFLSSGANALEVSAKLDSLLKEISQKLPPDIKFFFPYDPTIFIKESIKEVLITLGLAILLVVFVIYLFLGHFRATLIPVLAIPVSIIGCFAFLYAFGFSINLLTLFGLILAIGLVVDDAIIVIENVERIMREENLSPKEASLKAMEEISSPVIAIVLVLSAVFIPASFAGGFTGKFYQQFAITIATSMILSGLVALTLTPALCALILKKEEKPPFFFISLFQDFFELTRKSFTRNVSFILRKPFFFFSIFLLVIPLTFYLYKKLPTGLVPAEDKSALLWFVNLPPGSSLKRTEELISRIEDTLMKIPEVDRYVAISGLDFQGLIYKTDSAGGFIRLKDWEERKKETQSSFALVQKLNMLFSKEKEALIFVINAPAIMGLGRTGGFELYIQDRLGRGTTALFEVAQKFIAKANERPELTAVRTTLDVRTPYYVVKVDREKVYMYDVEIEDIYKTLSATFGASYVNDFNLYGRIYRVYLQAEGEFREDLRDYSRIFVKNKKGELIPLSNLIKIERIADVMVLDRINMFNAARVLGEPNLGYTTGQALKAVFEVAKEVLPEGFSLSFSGASFQELRVQQKTSQNMLYAIIFVYLILVALYESWSAPLAVMLSIPFAILGASLTLNIFRLENDIYFQVGLITLLGLSAKNAILVVEFAEKRLERGTDLISAAIEGARLRYRPIVMTSFAFIAGAIPLALSSGAGAASRHIIGWTVVGGMLFATLIGIFFIPLLYYLIKKFTSFKIPKLLIILISLFSVSCSSTFHHQKPQISLPHSISSQIFSKDNVLKEKYWEEFNDPILNKLVEEALKNNDDLMIASARLEQALKRIKYVEADKWPQVGYGAKISRERSSEETLTPRPGDTLSNYQLNLSVSYEIDLFKKLSLQKKSYIHQYLSTLEGKKALEISLTALVINTYFDLLSAQRRLEIASQFLKNQKQSYELRERSFKIGLSSEIPVLQAKSEWENTAILLENIKKEIKLYQDQLYLLLGKEPSELFGEKIKFARDLPSPLQIPAFLPSSLLEKRPDILQAEHNLLTAEYDLALAKREYFPRITLTSTLGLQSLELSNLIQASARYWNLAGLLSGTLLDLGRRKTKVEIAEAQKKEALYQYIKTVKEAFYEVSSALNELETVEAKLKELEKRVKTLEELYTLVRLKYEKGLVSFLEVLDAERQLLLAELELISLKGERLKRQILFIKALGGGFKGLNS